MIESKNVFSREVTLKVAWLILIRRRFFFSVTMLVFLTTGIMTSFTVGMPLTVSCFLKTAYMPPGSGTETIDEVNARVLYSIRTAVPESALLANCDRLDYSLWQQTVHFRRIGESRTLQIFGRTFSEEGAKRLATTAVEVLVVENNKAVAESLSIGRLRLTELKRLSVSASKMARSPSVSAEGLREFADSISGWSGAEATKTALELNHISKAEIVSMPKITRVTAIFNRAMIAALFAFLGAVTAFIAIFWMEAWRHGAPALFK